MDRGALPTVYIRLGEMLLNEGTDILFWLPVSALKN